VRFSKDTKSILPAPKELRSLQRRTLDEDEVQVDQELSANLQGLNREDLLAYSDVLTRAWRQILWDKSFQSTIIDLDTSFFELGGDIIGLAQVASLLEQEGYKLRVEDLVDHPIMIEQLALLAVYKKEENERLTAEVARTPATTQEEVVTPKKGLRKMLGKSISLAKRIGHRKGRDHSSAEGNDIVV
jgi:hypothetical protein